jgi:hypothetical protein
MSWLNDLHAVEELDIPRGPKLVLRCLVEHRNDGPGRKCNPSLARIAHKNGYSERHVRRCMRWLEEHGFSAATARFNGKGCQTSNHYVISDIPTPIAVGHGDRVGGHGVRPRADMVTGERPTERPTERPEEVAFSASENASDSEGSSLFKPGDSLWDLCIEDDDRGTEVLDRIMENEGITAAEFAMMNTNFIGRRYDSIQANHVWAAFREARQRFGVTEEPLIDRPAGITIDVPEAASPQGESSAESNGHMPRPANGNGGTIPPEHWEELKPVFEIKRNNGSTSFKPRYQLHADELAALRAAGKA